MAVKALVRSGPDEYRSGLESLVEGFNFSINAGTILFPVQIVTYDDTVVTRANY
jgi:hypothetical protein